MTPSTSKKQERYHRRTGDHSQTGIKSVLILCSLRTYGWEDDVVFEKALYLRRSKAFDAAMHNASLKVGFRKSLGIIIELLNDRGRAISSIKISLTSE